MKRPEQPERLPNKFDVAKEFSAGFAAALLPKPIDPTASEHWQAGYSAGYVLRGEKLKLMNNYLEAIGVEKIHMVSIC